MIREIINSRLLPLIGLTTILLAAINVLLQPTFQPYFSDNLSQFGEAWTTYSTIKEMSTIPMWRPYFDCGSPLLWSWIYIIIAALAMALRNLQGSINLFIAIFSIIPSFSMYYFTWKLLRHRGAALFAGLIFALSPYHIYEIILGHFGAIAGWIFVPLTFLFYIKALKMKIFSIEYFRYSVLAGLSLSATFLSYLEYGYIMTLFLIIHGFVNALVFSIGPLDSKQFVQRIKHVALLILIVGGVSFAVTSSLTLPFFLERNEYSRTLQGFTATLQDIEDHAIPLPTHLRFTLNWLLTTILLTISGLLMYKKELREKRDLITLIFLLILSLQLSFGPNLIYTFFFKYVPLFNGIRVPFKFLLISSLTLSYLAAKGLLHLRYSLSIPSRRMMLNIPIRWPLAISIIIVMAMSTCNFMMIMGSTEEGNVYRKLHFLETQNTNKTIGASNDFYLWQMNKSSKDYYFNETFYEKILWGLQMTNSVIQINHVPTDLSTAYESLHFYDAPSRRWIEVPNLRTSSSTQKVTLRSVYNFTDGKMVIHHFCEDGRPFIQMFWELTPYTNANITLTVKLNPLTRPYRIAYEANSSVKISNISRFQDGYHKIDVQNLSSPWMSFDANTVNDSATWLSISKKPFKSLLETSKGRAETILLEWCWPAVNKGQSVSLLLTLGYWPGDTTQDGNRNSLPDYLETATLGNSFYNDQDAVPLLAEESLLLYNYSTFKAPTKMTMDYAVLAMPNDFQIYPAPKVVFPFQGKIQGGRLLYFRVGRYGFYSVVEPLETHLEMIPVRIHETINSKFLLSQYGVQVPIAYSGAPYMGLAKAILDFYSLMKDQPTFYSFYEYPTALAGSAQGAPFYAASYHHKRSLMGHAENMYAYREFTRFFTEIVEAYLGQNITCTGLADVLAHLNCKYLILYRFSRIEEILALYWKSNETYTNRVSRILETNEFKVVTRLDRKNWSICIFEISKWQPRLISISKNPVLIIGNSAEENFYSNTILRVFQNKRNDSGNLLPVVGRSKYIDEYDLDFLCKFKAVLLFEATYHNQGTASSLLDEYQKQGGLLMNLSNANANLNELWKSATEKAVFSIIDLSYKPGAIHAIINVNSSKSFFCTSESFFLGWTMHVNGEEHPILLADGFLMGTYIEKPGIYEITLRYDHYSGTIYREISKLVTIIFTPIAMLVVLLPKIINKKKRISIYLTLLFTASATILITFYPDALIFIISCVLLYSLFLADETPRKECPVN